MSLFNSHKNVSIPNKDILSWIFDDPKYDQDEPIYIDAKIPSRTISLNEARILIRKLVAGLQAAGLSKGDCVCLSSFNDIYYPIIVLGIIAAGGVFTGSNPGYTEFEVKHHIRTAKVTLIISEPEVVDGVFKAATDCGIPKSKVLIFHPLDQAIPAGFKSWKSLLDHGEKDWVRFDDREISKNTTAARLFSSGTTGLPKAVNLSHHNFVAQHTLCYEINIKPFRRRYLIPLPMFHAACAPLVHTGILKGGYIAVIMRRFELEPFFASVEKFTINDMILVPPIVIAIIMSKLADKYSLNSLQSVVMGAAPLSAESQSRFRKLLRADAKVTQVFGMTESCCLATMFYHPEDDDTGSVGRLIPNCDLKLIDEEGNDITGYDIRGEMCIRGPTITSGYFENPNANAAAFDSEGYYKTGDIMYCDEKTNKWYVVDRKKELIKVRGFQVAPPELESVLLSHPLIVDAAVVGVKHPSETDVELPRAYVVKRSVPESKSLDEKTVKEYCNVRLAKYKELTGGVRFLDAIPKTASGKILKRILREEAKTEIDQQRAKI